MAEPSLSPRKICADSICDTPGRRVSPGWSPDVSLGQSFYGGIFTKAPFPLLREVASKKEKKRDRKAPTPARQTIFLSQYVACTKIIVSFTFNVLHQSLRQQTTTTQHQFWRRERQMKKKLREHHLVSHGAPPPLSARRAHTLPCPV